MKIIKKKIADLKPAKYNPRRISETAKRGLEASLKRFGCVDPIVWNKRTNTVVGGHQRLEILASQGIETIECVEVDLEEKEEKALNVALNSEKLQGEWDLPRLEEVLDEISALTQIEELQFEALREKLEVIDFGGDDHSGQSPWDRMQDEKSKENVLFSFGAIQVRIPQNIYEEFKAAVDLQQDVPSFIIEKIQEAFCENSHC